MEDLTYRELNTYLAELIRNLGYEVYDHLPASPTISVTVTTQKGRTRVVNSQVFQIADDIGYFVKKASIEGGRLFVEFAKRFEKG